MAAEQPDVRDMVFNERPWYVWALVFAICISSFGSNFVTTDLPISLRKFQKDTQLSHNETAVLLASGYFLGIFTKTLGGILADFYGGRTITACASFLGAASTLAFSYCPNNLYLFALFRGIAFAAIISVEGTSRQVLLGHWVPQSMQGRMMGIMFAIQELGEAGTRAILSPFLHLGWRQVHQAAALGTFIFVLPLLLFPNYPPEEHESESSGSESFLSCERQVEVSDKAAVVEATPVASQATPAAKEHPTYFTLVKQLLVNPVFILMCLVSANLYAVRTLFLNYAATLLARTHCGEQGFVVGTEDFDACCLDPKTLRECAVWSGSFAFAGAFSPFVFGSLKDALPSRHRAAPLVAAISPLLICMLLFMLGLDQMSFYVVVVLMAISGACAIGPLRMMKVFTLELGGKELKGLAVSTVGLSNQISATMLVLIKGNLGDNLVVIFTIVSCVCVLALGMSMALWAMDLMRYRKEQREAAEKASEGHE